jgi:hypothetical protein
MSQYQISKKRLTEIIEEEYESLLKEQNPMMDKIAQWSEEGEAIPREQTVDRMRDNDDGSRDVIVTWDEEGPGDAPEKQQRIHVDSVKDYYVIASNEGKGAADTALSNMLSDETGWLVVDWQWAG